MLMDMVNVGLTMPRLSSFLCEAVEVLNLLFGDKAQMVSLHFVTSSAFYSSFSGLF